MSQATPGQLLSLSNIPNHLGIFVFGLPDRDAIGVSVLLVLPFLLYLSAVRRWDLINKLIVVNVATILMAVLAFRSTGAKQMGYRFSLDFLPFVFWLLMRSRVQLTNGFKWLILVATIIDLFLAGFFLATRY